MKNTIENLSSNPNFENVRNWAGVRGILVNGNELTQKLKLYEEFGELCGGVLKNKIDLTKDSVGDMIVVMTNLTAINNVSIEKYFVKKYNLNSGALELSIKNILAAIAFRMSDLLQSDYCMKDGALCCDIMEWLVVLCWKQNIDANECFNLAWNEIKNRTGKNVDGNFIKDE